MSWTDKELSDMARKAEADHAFTYQDSFWSEMEALLPAKKKRFWPYFLAIAIPLAGTTALLFAWQSSTENFMTVAKTNSFEVNRSHAVVNESIINTEFESINTQATESIKIDGQGITIPVLSEIENSTSTYKTNTESKSSIKKNAVVEAKNKNLATIQSLTPLLGEDTEVQPNAVVRENSSQAPVEMDKRATEIEISESEYEVGNLTTTPVSTLYINNDNQIASIPYFKKRKYYSVFGELGLGIGETYTSDQIGHTESIALTLGARVTKNKVFAQIGIGFEAENARLELSQREKIYNYSVNIYENKMSYKQMYRLNIPINFGYQINKHVLQVGATASYLMSTKMKYSYLENEYVKRNETIYGNKTGWNSYGIRMNLGYGFMILPSTTLGANFQVQLINQLDRNWTPNDNKMPVSGQVFIRKTFR